MYNYYRQCSANHYPYTIQPGDTLYNISQRLEVSLERILAANPGINPYYLRVGQRLCIPSGNGGSSNCGETVTAMQEDIDMLIPESSVQQTHESNYGDSTQTTSVIMVNSGQIRFDVVPVNISGDYVGHYTEGKNYPYYADAASGGQRGINVKDNFGVWHSFGYRVPVT
ncbi:Gamma-D-glutamyl-L-diamino acid endopeptidase 1 [Clostridiaceae bacterium BL-3]|nr:Gamma-D-glutamyl-L-diamino acid endopeptidase 1 [Clostridiaceae bacterium BL-3]